MKRLTRSKATVLSIFLFLQIIARAQLKEAYEKGTVVLQNGHQLSGYIQDDDLSGIVHKLRFKLSLADKKPVVYDTAQVKSFNRGSGNVFELLRLGVDSATKEVSVFAKLLVKGKASLYKTLYNNEDLYAVEKNNRFFVLQNDKIEPGSTEMTRFHYKENLLNAVDGFLPSDISLERLEFSEKTFVHILSGYNTANGSPNEIMNPKKKPVHFVLAYAGGMLKNSKENEYFLQAFYRTYFPSVSRGTSLNIGLGFYAHKFSDTVGFYYRRKEDFTSKLFSLPIQVQQNFLNKNVRPYVFAGICLSYFDVANEKGVSPLKEGLQNSFGVGLSIGGGVEADIFKGLLLKAEYRNEIYSHLVMVGIGYNFSK